MASVAASKAAKYESSTSRPPEPMVTGPSATKPWHWAITANSPSSVKLPLVTLALSVKTPPAATVIGASPVESVALPPLTIAVPERVKLPLLTAPLSESTPPAVTLMGALPVESGAAADDRRAREGEAAAAHRAAVVEGPAHRGVAAGERGPAGDRGRARQGQRPAGRPCRCRRARRRRRRSASCRWRAWPRRPRRPCRPG